jgi:hypothetical protein
MKSFLKGFLVVAFVGLIGAGLSGQLNGLVLGLPAEPAAAVAISNAPAADVVDADAQATIQHVIQRSNEQQAQAIAARDPSLMNDGVTSEHYQELVQINRGLLRAGVSGIQLVDLEWGPIAVDGSTATATTYETWTTTYADGATERSRDRNDYALVLDAGTWKISANTHPGDQPQAIAPPPQTQPDPGIPNARNTSHNWSGYAATGGTYTAVSGTWTVPPFNASDGSYGVDAAWVGIGGVRTRDLIQAGTQQTVTGSGRTQYQAWVETLPQASRPVPLRIHPGDSISVSISEQSPDQWLIQLVNNTTGQSYQETQEYRSTRSSAEWIQEAPSSVRGSVLPLSNFGTVQFSSGSAVKNGETVSIASAGARAISMVASNEQVLAVPSPLGDDGSSFSVARTDAPATTAAPRQRQRRAP